MDPREPEVAEEAEMAPQPERRQAVADVVGSLCYALLHAFEAAARGTTAAPSVTLGEHQAAFAAAEFERYRQLREHLTTIADDPLGALASSRAPLDAFFAHARPEDWLETQVFHFVGDTVMNDFAELLTPHLEPETADAVTRALTGRGEQQGFSLEQIGDAVLAEGAEAQARVKRFAGTMVGQALNRLREGLMSNDALAVVLGGEGGVKELVLELLGRHRERLERLGLDPLDD